MPLSQWNLEFLNHNAQRAYPLTAESTRTDVTGSFRIPEDFLVDMDIPLPAAIDMDSSRFFIRQLGLFASGVQLIISYDDGTEIVDVVTALIPSTLSGRNITANMGGLAPYDDVVGKVVIGKLDNLKRQPTGLFNFTLEDTRLEPQVIRPMLRTVTAIQIADATGESSERFYGDIELVAGSNIQLVAESTANGAQITISAIDGEGTVEACLCEGEAATIPCIKTINGIRPTLDGNFNLNGDDCISFEAIQNGLKATDSCCAPCCGCAELETVTRELERLNSQRGALDMFVNNLLTETTTFHSTVLGSRLGDRRCLTCK